MVDAEMLAERCSANDAAEWQNVLALPQNEKQQSIGKAALAELYRPRINDTQKSACAKRQNAAVHWQNVVLLPQNETQQSNGKVRVQRQNAAVQTMPWRTGRMFLALPQNKWEKAGAQRQNAACNMKCVQNLSINCRS